MRGDAETGRRHLTTDARFQYRLGTTLVTLQFPSIIVLAWLPWPAVVSGEAPTAAWICAVLGIFLGVWAVSVNWLGNFNIRLVLTIKASFEEPRMLKAHPGYGAYRQRTSDLFHSCLTASPAANLAAGLPQDLTIKLVAVVARMYLGSAGQHIDVIA